MSHSTVLTGSPLLEAVRLCTRPRRDVADCCRGPSHIALFRRPCINAIRREGASLIDPNARSRGAACRYGQCPPWHPEKRLQTLPVKSYRRAATFLMASGYKPPWRTAVAGAASP